MAFAPASGTGFVVVGTRHGAIHWWSLPTVAELKAELSTTVTFVEQAIESSGRTARILVDFENPKRDGRYALRPGTAVTLVIKPRK